MVKFVWHGCRKNGPKLGIDLNNMPVGVSPMCLHGNKMATVPLETVARQEVRALRRNGSRRFQALFSFSQTVAEEAEKVVVKDSGDAEQDVRVDGPLAEDFVDIRAAAWQLFCEPCHRESLF